ncbi:MAG: hypothetical protein WC647_19550 [Desulfomonilaceae bacterium]|jgi:hypothetical protein
MKNQKNTNIVRLLSLALALAIWSPVQALSAGPGEGKMMGGNMMNQTDGWMGGWAGGGMWVWTVVGILVIVLLVVVISRLIKK